MVLYEMLFPFSTAYNFYTKNITLAKAAETLNILDYDYYLQIADFAKSNDIPGILSKLNEIVNKGFDPHIFIGGLGSHFRD
jgi:DNA polymerase-3 subunit gamma/tau